MAHSPLVRLQRSLAQEVRTAAEDLPAVFRELAAAQVRREDTDPIVADLAERLARIGMAGDLGARIAFRFGKAKVDPGQFIAINIGRLWDDEEPSLTPKPGMFDPWNMPPELRPDIPLEVPMVPFHEAAEWLQSRDPVGYLDLLSMGADVAATYQHRVDPVTQQVTSGHGFALALAMTPGVAAAARDELVRGILDGHTHDRVAEDMVERWGWPDRYAQTIVRTTYNAACTAGTFQQAIRAEDAGFKVEMVFETAGDSDVRSGRPKDHGENHAAMDGYRAPADSSVWDLWSPPLGPNCRCLTRPELVDEYSPVLPVPAAARKAPGFGGRDRSAYPRI